MKTITCDKCYVGLNKETAYVLEVKVVTVHCSEIRKELDLCLPCKNTLVNNIRSLL